MHADLILAPCRASCDGGWVVRYEKSVRIDERCPRCGGTGKEPPLPERELEARGQEVLFR